MSAAPRYRCLSAPGAAALSIWELRGSVADFETVLANQALPPEGPPRLRRLVDRDGDVLDEGLFLWNRAAGESRAEWHLHGGFGVSAALRGRLGELGWCQDSTEFSPDERRYYEALAPLNAGIAETALDGRLDSAIASAQPEDVERWAQWGSWLDHPPRCVLAGPSNAGKSTLFNAWLQEHRVTVSPHPGTTRDTVTAGIRLGSGEGAWEARLVDTAGWWGGATGADAAALDATDAALASADRVVWVFDASQPPSREWLERLAAHPRSAVRVRHRTDLGENWSPDEPGEWLSGSVVAEGLSFLERVEAALTATFGLPPAIGDPVPLGPERLGALRSRGPG